MGAYTSTRREDKKPDSYTWRGRGSLVVLSGTPGHYSSPGQDTSPTHPQTYGEEMGIKGLVRMLPMPQVTCELSLSGYYIVNAIPKDYFLGCTSKLRTIGV